MGWTLPSVRSIGDLITAAIWNTDLKDNLILLKTSVNNDGTLHGCARLLDQSTTEQDVVNTAAETSVYSFSIPSNTLGTAGSLRLTVTGNYLNNTGSGQSIFVAVKLGGTIFAGSLSAGLASVSTSALRRGFLLQAVLNANGATNAQRAVTRAMLGLAAATETDWGNTTVAFDLHCMHSALAKDMTAAQTITMTITHGTASSNLSFKRWGATLELVAP